jgi:hypothetical protein
MTHAEGRAELSIPPSNFEDDLNAAKGEQSAPLNRSERRAEARTRRAKSQRPLGVKPEKATDAHPETGQSSQRGFGRPPGRKNNRPNIDGFHDERVSADILGEDIQTRRRKRRAGLPPLDWILVGRHVLYPDGCEQRYAAELLARRTAAAEVPGRGRPRRGGR